jgi:sugar (pentulose or hexulose) kinase
VAQKEHEQITPEAGWVEHDATEVWRRTREVIGGALASSDVEASDIAAIGITNQRETTVVWDRESGEPVYNAIVWQDTRTGPLVRESAGDEGLDRLRDKTGLPLSTYFSGPKIAWILDNVDGARDRAENGELAFGTMDTWVLWNLTGGRDGGLHVTDVTNASRTLMMDLETLDWHEPSLELMGVPRSMLPEIRSSSEEYGEVKGTAVGGRPVSGILGDQHAALFGQTCFEPDDAKNTYGTGSFLLVNTGNEIHRTEKLLTSVGYKIGDADPTYVLEGSIAVTSALVQWLRDRLGLIDEAPEVEELAKKRGRQRRRLLRARVLGAVRALLARRRARGDPRPDRVRELRAHRASGARGHGLADQGGRGRGQRSGRRAVRRAAGGRGDGGERAADAVPGGRARGSGDPAGGHRDHRARRGLRRRPGGGLLVRPGRAARALVRGQALGAEHGGRRPRRAVREVEEGRRAQLRLGRLTSRTRSPVGGGRRLRHTRG